MYQKYSVGIDIAKDSFKVCMVLSDATNKITIKSSGSFSNSIKGFDQLVTWVEKRKKEKAPVSFLMEATGIYYEQLAWFLHKKDLQVAVVLPNKAKRYMQSLGIKTKNDKIDAKGLAYMGAQQELRPWKPLTDNLYVLRSLTRHLEALQDQKTVFNNQLQSAELSMYNLKEVKKSLKGLVGQIDKQIIKVKAEIEKTIQKDELLNAKYQLVEPIKGIGLITFAVVVAETNGFTNFENQKQLVSYCGYDVVESQSGKRSGKTRISKKGNAHIRRAMFMPAFSAVTNKEKVFVDLFERVFDRTRIKMKAYVAVQRKMLCLIYSLWKNNSTFDPQFRKGTSGIHETRALFPVGPLGPKTKEASREASQDGLPYNQSTEALFPVKQI